ncbi:nuclear transport factor 2 family protein [Rhodococcus sp. SG20037]|uniref:nuclear transport factor 2 family protein n=1 Tax=Rhodococcus sp. SG20037 TaxID=3074148 RepID=UPI00287FB964|nr:nuclear transport factor 2 family protein [Rhodococcus sp. SG20037]WNF41794.1 nuclear transport factor 2 family protein [Rhodococcus sp. SG20037]
MAPSAEVIRKTVDAYIETVATGTAAQVVALYAEGATVEDPVGTDVRTTRESILEFYSVIENFDQEAHLQTLRIAGNEAAFHFSLITKLGEQTLTIAPIDVMTFDDDGRILSMRAFWNQEDMITA